MSMVKHFDKEFKSQAYNYRVDKNSKQVRRTYRLAKHTYLDGTETYLFLTTKDNCILFKKSTIKRINNLKILLTILKETNW